METDIIAQTTYLILLGLLLAVGFWTKSRKNLGQTLQHAVIWVLIFVAGIAIFGLWSDVERHLGQHSTTVGRDGRIEIPVDRDGHYYIELIVNDVPIEFVIDTGASKIVLSKHDAEKIGLDTDKLNYFGRAATANGEVKTAGVTLNSVKIGDISDYNVPAVVNGGKMPGSLLGMGYLELWGRIEIANGILTLRR